MSFLKIIFILLFSRNQRPQLNKTLANCNMFLNFAEQNSKTNGVKDTILWNHTDNSAASQTNLLKSANKLIISVAK